MIPYKYGKFTKRQIDDYKKKLHSRIHWLLLYKDPNVVLDREVTQQDFDNYFNAVLNEIDGFNSLFDYPSEIVSLASILEYTNLITKNKNYSFKKYRKLIFDAHSQVDKLFNEYYKNNEEVVANGN